MEDFSLSHEDKEGAVFVVEGETVRSDQSERSGINICLGLEHINDNKDEGEYEDNEEDTEQDEPECLLHLLRHGFFNMCIHASTSPFLPT